MSTGTSSVFAARLKQARIAAGISQRALGMALGYPPDSASPRMNQYEQGKREPGLATARQIAVQLGIPLAYLYCEEPDLADLILRFAKMNASERASILRSVERFQHR